MALPIPANITFDIYRAGTTPPAAPAVAGVLGHLQCDWRGGQEGGDRLTNGLCWTHVVLIDVSIDLRDAYVGQGSYVTQDAVYIPDKNGTPFAVVFIERLQRGAPNEHKRVYLDRMTPVWPTNEL
ncbi:MAG: hypothetical protein EXS16_00845 [Gemmataceae bacterium]|nr:hypothetical protein [Gemmataceae bacterium]